MSEKSVPEIIQDRLEESGIEIRKKDDGMRGMKLLVEGPINQAEEIVQEFEYSSVKEYSSAKESAENRFIVMISDHIFE